MSIKSIIFDLDGTLLDTLFDIANCTNLMLKRFDFPQHSVNSIKNHIGEGAHTLIKRVLPESERNSARFSKYFKEFQEIYRDKWCDQATLYQGIAELLDELVIRNIGLNILSNKPHEHTLTVFQEKLSNWKFDYVYGQSEFVPRKPDPAGALEIMQKSGFQNSEFLFIGDTAVDIKTALASRITSIGVLWGFRGKSELRESGAEHIAAHPGQILEIIDNLNKSDMI